MNWAGMLIKILTAEDSELTAKSSSEILQQKGSGCIRRGCGEVLRYMSAATAQGILGICCKAETL